MANLTVKGVPDMVVTELKKQAAAHRRSLNGEVLHRLERSLDSSADTAAWLERVRAIRERARVETTVEEIIEARDFGRK